MLALANEQRFVQSVLHPAYRRAFSVLGGRRKSEDTGRV